jgi:AcrR family transcriptional regulator
MTTSVRPPQQARSARTLTRIGQAITYLLTRKSYDEITVQEIVQRAGTSVGSFYARFSGKDSLLSWLEEHYFRASRQAIAEELDPAKWEGVPLPDLIARVTRRYLSFLREHEALLRPIALENRRNPDGIVARHARPLNEATYERLTQLLLARREEIRHPDPAFAARFGLSLVFAASHELILFRASRLHPIAISDDRLAAELTRAFLGVLGVTS